MAPETQFLLGEYGARIDNVEAAVQRIDSNVAYLVSRETERAASAKTAKVYAGAILSVVASLGAFVLGVVKDWLLP